MEGGDLPAVCATTVWPVLWLKVPLPAQATLPTTAVAAVVPVSPPGLLTRNFT